MLLPVLKGSTTISSEGLSVADFIKNSTKNLQRAAASMPGNSGSGGLTYLTFNGQTGVWKFNREVVDPKSLGRIVIPQHGFFEAMIEWGGGQVLQKVPQRQLLGVDYDEPMTEKMFSKPLSPHLYKKENDGPKYVLGFIGFMLDDGASVSFESTSQGGTKAVNAIATTSTQAMAAFGEMVHMVVELNQMSYESGGNINHNPIFKDIGYVTDKRTREAATLTDKDIVTRPTPSHIKQRRAAIEAPAI
jgi:hypothetical protein